MRSAALAFASRDGELTLWRIVEAPAPPTHGPSLPGWALPAGLAGLALLVTVSAASAVWLLTGPDTVVRTRILAEGATVGAGRAALSELVLRFASGSSDQVLLQDGGDSLVVTAQDRSPATAQVRSDSLVNAILNAPVRPVAFAPAPPPEPIGPEGRLRAERARLVAASDAADARWVAVSTSLSALARDVASATRSATDRMAGRETLDKGNAALADLQLQRLQLASKYQDTYPAVIALDQQIRNLRVFLNDEARRVEGRQPAVTQADALLGQERDRLRAELSQVEDRRRALAGELAKVDQRLAALPPNALLPVVPAAPVRPVLVAAATTTSLAGPDGRMLTVPVILAVGALASALCWLLGRRARPQPGGGMMLQQVAAGLLPPDGGRALAAAPGALAIPPAMARLLERPGWSAHANDG